NVLPELGEDNTYDMTFYDLLCQNINEYKDIENFTDFISRYYKGNVDNYDMVKYKQSDEIIKDIDSYINNLLSTIKFNNKLEYDNFIEIDTEELNNMLNYKYNRFPLFERIKEISKRIASNNYEGSTKNASSIEKKLKELLNIKLDLKDIFNNFYQSEYSKYKDKVNDKYLYYEDACIFLYIKSLLVGFNTNHVIKEIVIDEAQDYNKLQYLIIKKTFKTSNYTILGDTNQTINPYYKYDSLEELTSIFESSKYITLTKTYRSTGKIIDYTNKILGLNHVTAIRNDKASDIIFRNNITKNDFLTDINNLKTISKSIAIITKNDKEAEKVYNMLKDDLDIMLIDGFGHIKRDLVVVPSYVAKGLEFDSVIIYTDEDNKYQEKDKYLFYVACTRAQHNLIIYNNSK
nr:ATP-binding domain-containing protein [Bacilli bacterium]